MQLVAADDVLAGVERALQGLRKTMAALPTAAGASPAALYVRRPISGASCGSTFVDSLGLLQSSVRRPGKAQEFMGDDASSATQLSVAEVGLANAMELLDSSFKDTSFSPSLTTTPPPRPKLESPGDPSVSAEPKTEAAQSRLLVPAHKSLRDSLSSRMFSSPPEKRSSPQMETTAAAVLNTASSVRMSVETTPSKVSMRPRRPPLAPTSLASRLSSFEPPVPPVPKALRSQPTLASCSELKLAEARTELKLLSDAARRAAQLFPQAAMLTDCLCAAVTRELQGLSADSQRPTFPRERQEMERRIYELRKATAEGLQALEGALQPDASEGSSLHAACLSASEEEACGGQIWRSPPAALDTSGSTIGSVRSSPRSPAEISDIFGSVAANMQQTVDEIRKARAARAGLHHRPLLASHSSSPVSSSCPASPSMALAAAAGA